MNKLIPVYWTDQQTGDPIGPLYSWNDIREMQLEDDVREMLKRKRITYVDNPNAPSDAGTVIQSLIDT